MWQNSAGKNVTFGQLKCTGAIAALLKDVIKPNLVQTLEKNPAFVHGGPFANIAHGCNSVNATLCAQENHNRGAVADPAAMCNSLLSDAKWWVCW